MIELSEDEFYDLVQAAVAEIPARYADHLANVAFMTADEPRSDQLVRGGVLHGHMTLLGLYEGVPLPARAGGYSGVVPDVITIFRLPHLRQARSLADLRQSVHETVWHEVAHYFGLDHGQIEALNSSNL